MGDTSDNRDGKAQYRVEGKNVKRSKRGRLFRDCGGRGKHVVLNFRPYRSPFEFAGFADAFRDDAARLAKALAETQGYSDLRALSIVFLYRHAAELYLKAIVILDRCIESLSKEEGFTLADIFESHGLSRLLVGLETAFARAEWDWPPVIEIEGEAMSVVDVVEELNEVDARSIAFRYPVDKNLKASLEYNFRFDIEHFAEAMEVLCGTLAGICLELDRRLDILGDAYDYI